MTKPSRLIAEYRVQSDAVTASSWRDSRCHALYVVIAALSLITAIGYSRRSAMPGTAAGLILSKMFMKGEARRGTPSAQSRGSSTPDTDVER